MARWTSDCVRSHIDDAGGGIHDEPRSRTHRSRSARDDDRRRPGSARWRRMATARRSSSARPVDGGRTPSSPPTSTRWLWACSPSAYEPGDRVGIWAPNCAEWVLTQYATARIGAVLVTVNPAYRTHELSFVIGQSGLRTMVAASSFKGAELRRHDRRGACRAPCAGRRRADRRAVVGRSRDVGPGGRRRGARRDRAPSCRPATRSTSSTRRARRASRRARRSRTATSSTTGGSSAS